MRIVIKVGSNVLTGNSEQIQDVKIEQLIKEIRDLKDQGHSVALVTSGAIATGKQRAPNLDFDHKKQAWAAIGQPILMEKYNKVATKYGMILGQCLLLRNDFTDRESYDNFVGTIEDMLKDQSVLPVINENDVVATSDLTVGDNDTLSAMLAIAVEADKLVILTNQTGLYTGNPDMDPNATLISEVKNVDAELEKLAKVGISASGRGGMLSKVRAAKQAVHAGIETYILDGREKDQLKTVLSETHSGTKFITSESKAHSPAKRWMMSAKGFGQIIIDDGAVAALQKNKSLLLPGIIGVRGMFEKAEIVEVVSKSGLGVAYGKTGYDSKEIQNGLLARKTDKKATLPKEVIHYDHMVIMKG